MQTEELAREAVTELLEKRSYTVSRLVRVLHADFDGDQVKEGTDQLVEQGKAVYVVDATRGPQGVHLAIEVQLVNPPDPSRGGTGVRLKDILREITLSLLTGSVPDGISPDLKRWYQALTSPQKTMRLSALTAAMQPTFTSWEIEEVIEELESSHRVETCALGKDLEIRPTREAVVAG